MNNFKSLCCVTLAACSLFASSSYAAAEYAQSPYVIDCIMGEAGATYPAKGTSGTYMVHDHFNAAGELTYKSCEINVGTVSYDEMDQAVRYFVRCIPDANKPEESFTPSSFLFHPNRHSSTNCVKGTQSKGLPYTNDNQVATFDCQRAADLWEGHVEVHSVWCPIGGNISGDFDLRRA